MIDFLISVVFPIGGIWGIRRWRRWKDDRLLKKVVAGFKSIEQSAWEMNLKIMIQIDKITNLYQVLLKKENEAHGLTNNCT